MFALKPEEISHSSAIKLKVLSLSSAIKNYLN